MSATASGDSTVPELGEGRLEAGVRLGVAAQQALDAGAGGGEAHAQRVRLGGTIAMLSISAARLSANRPVAASARSAPAAARPAPARERSRGGGAGRRRTSARARRRAPRGRLARFAEDGDRGGVALAAARSTWWARADAAHRGPPALGAAVVGAEQPAAGGRLVDRAADERVAEAEPPRDVGGADEVAAQQLVERVQRPPARALPWPPPRARGRRGRLRPRLPRAPGGCRRRARRAPRRAPRRRSAGPSCRPSRIARGRRRRCRSVDRARELLEVEGVAAALLVDDRRAAPDRLAE